jgi:hypothetical protein
MRITVKTKLAAAFATVITAWLGISNLASLDGTMSAVLSGPVERIQMAQDLHTDLLLTIRGEKNVLLAGTNAADRARYDAELLKQREAVGAQLDKLDGVATVDGKRRLAALRVTRQQWIEVNDKVRSLARDNQAAEAISSANSVSTGDVEQGREQDIGADQINQAIQQLDKVTQQNASASEQMSATSEELAAQAEQLQSSIAYFHVNANGAGTETAEMPRRAAKGRVMQPALTARPVRPVPARSVRNGADRSKPNGFALNLAAGGADHRDVEFERM